MNILFCDPHQFKSGGTAAAHIYGVLISLSKLGHNVVLINGDHPISETETDLDRRSWLQGRTRNILMRWRILRLVAGEIAIIRLFLRSIYVFSLTFIMIARRKRRFDVIYRRHTLFNCEYLLAKMFNIPLVKEVNGLVADEIKTMGLGNRISLRVMDRIERFNMPKADKIIVVTSRLKEVLQKDYGVPADKIVVIPNGANTDLFKPMDATRAREKLNLNQSNNYVCYVGAFHAWQGIEYLVKSAPLVLQKCPDTRFLIVGDGLIKQELINLAEQLGVSDKMIFTGMVPYRKVPLYMNASDVCVFSAARSFRNERTGGSPLKLYEYMACGRPVVVGNIAGISEDVMDSGSGFVTDPTNAIEMARAIMALLENEQLRKEMGERGKKFTIERHSWMKVAEQVAEVCQSVIKNRR